MSKVVLCYVSCVRRKQEHLVYLVQNYETREAVMRRAIFVVLAIASVYMGGCFTLMPAREIEKKFLGGPIIVTPEETPQNVAVISTDADATIIRWNTAASRQPVLSLYQL